MDRMNNDAAKARLLWTSFGAIDETCQFLLPMEVVKL